MKNQHIEVEVFRFDPGCDVEPRYETYSVPKTEGMSVLEALKYIYDNEAPIGFRYSCRHNVCGTCGVMVNGRPSLACDTTAAAKIKVDPLRGFPIVRDLVVDFEPSYFKRLKLRPFIDTKGEVELRSESITYDIVQQYKQFINCIHCYLCLSACPLVEEHGFKFAGPAIMSDIAMQSRDPRDKGDRVGVAVSEGALLCDECRKCVEVCPSELPVDKMIYKYFQDKAKKR
jgi:succinate dehydrogenase/fumarate reductase iron-sulfur protein